MIGLLHGFFEHTNGQPIFIELVIRLIQIPALYQQMRKMILGIVNTAISSINRYTDSGQSMVLIFFHELSHSLENIVGSKIRWWLEPQGFQCSHQPFSMQ